MQLLSGLLTKGFTATESAAATWTTDEISVPSASRENIGVIVVGIEGIVPNCQDVPAAGVSQELCEVYVLEEDKATEPNPTDDDIMGYVFYGFNGDATNILFINKQYLRLWGRLVSPVIGFVTVRESIYWGIISTNSGNPAILQGFIYFYLVKLSDAEIKDLALREAFD